MNRAESEEAAREAARAGYGWEDVCVRFGLTETHARLIVSVHSGGSDARQTRAFRAGNAEQPNRRNYGSRRAPRRDDGAVETTSGPAANRALRRTR